MDGFRTHRLCFVTVCLCGLAAGCVTTTEQPQSTFTFAAPGSYGQPQADSAAAPGKTTTGFVWPWSSKRKVDPNMQLAYARWEESRANQAAARKDTEEQRSALAAARRSYEQVLETDKKSTDAI